jgi:hypothetical protein
VAEAEAHEGVAGFGLREPHAGVVAVHVHRLLRAGTPTDQASERSMVLAGLAAALSMPSVLVAVASRSGATLNTCSESATR